MPPSTPPASGETAIADRFGVFDWVALALALALLAWAPFLIADVAGETVEYRRGVLDRESPGWIAGPVVIVLGLVWPALRLIPLARRMTAVRIDAERIRLYAEFPTGGNFRSHPAARVDALWSDVDRLVLWRLRVKRFGFIPGWRPQLGVVTTADQYGVSQKEPSRRQRLSEDVRRDGVPVRLGHMMKARSVKLSASRAEDVAAAVRRVAPRVALVDERKAGTSPNIEPPRLSS
ncbi:hypothetical protein [Glycomyces harbinensis]|uniref:Uncharacterized protein n=1 Tax=Glycomyces harbinensis TaxID=58114 RepID=A0A1G7C0U7_9ACTN|nr:hypothetical protein [Glycomyces harbinensis]SDE32984.1 hypothetical protein SAMN05216270_11888 [Glycomyces harbinensis]